MGCQAESKGESALPVFNLTVAHVEQQPCVWTAPGCHFNATPAEMLTHLILQWSIPVSLLMIWCYIYFPKGKFSACRWTNITAGSHLESRNLVFILLYYVSSLFTSGCYTVLQERGKMWMAIWKVPTLYVPFKAAACLKGAGSNDTCPGDIYGQKPTVMRDVMWHEKTNQDTVFILEAQQKVVDLWSFGISCVKVIECECTATGAFTDLKFDPREKCFWTVELHEPVSCFAAYPNAVDW